MVYIRQKQQNESLYAHNTIKKSCEKFYAFLRQNGSFIFSQIETLRNKIVKIDTKIC